MSCKHCGGKSARKSYIYCSNLCQQDYELYRRIASGNFAARTAKRYLIKTEGCCKICGLKDWNDKDLVLILDHIDGNSENNNLDNLRLVCPNCDSQLPTFKNRNKGHGRHSRRQRYADNKSY